MAIAGYAIGADQGYVIYVRAEYPIAVQRLSLAIGQAEEYGLLGDDILGLGFKFQFGDSSWRGRFCLAARNGVMTSIEGNQGRAENQASISCRRRSLWQNRPY